MNYYGEHNIQPMRAKITTATDTLLIGKDVTMEQIAAVCNIDINEIKALNPQYQTTLIPGYRTKCTLRLPQDQTLNFIELQDSIYNYGISGQEKTSDQIDVKEFASSPSYTSDKSRSKSKSKSYSSRSRKKSVTVKSGQTLGEIARKNNTTVEKLRRLNGIKGSNIRAGRKLRVR